ncbi:MAG: hypothetical protein M9953_12335 [Thermomicrobiales bacterium]|nr:hypothetical protein [Thermomicrobiales bacterium]
MSNPVFDALTADREVFLAEWTASRAELDTALAGLSDVDLEEPGITGDWNGRQTLVHIARWDEVTTEMILRDHFGELPGVNEYGDYEGWNLRWAAIDADIPLEAAWQRYHSAHEAIVRTMRWLPDSSWNAYVRGWVREASLNHYRHHAETTQRWIATRSR